MKDLLIFLAGWYVGSKYVTATVSVDDAGVKVSGARRSLGGGGTAPDAPTIDHAGIAALDGLGDHLLPLQDS